MVFSDPGSGCASALDRCKLLADTWDPYLYMFFTLLVLLINTLLDSALAPLAFASPQPTYTIPPSETGPTRSWKNVELCGLLEDRN